MRRHKHNLNHYRIMSGRMGELLPVKCIEALPGDTFRCQSTALVRFSPMLAPIMHPVYLRLHTFFVPNRLVMDQWPEFIVDMNTNMTVPVYSGVVEEGSTLDYLGVPPGDYADNPVNALPLRCVSLIWNEFFRDQDLQAERDLSSNTLPRINWEKDYFTTARTEPQSGATETVDIEFDQDVPIAGLGVGPDTAFDPALEWKESDGTTKQGAGAFVSSNQVGTNTAVFEENPNDPTFPNVRIAAGTVGGSMDINEWRRAMAWQRLAEHRNKYGSRYTDYLRFLGVRSSDARLQRPEYLGGGSSTIQISEVLATADTFTDVQQGAELGKLGGHGIAGHRTKPMTYFCEEHGHIVTLASIRPKTVYNTSIHRNFYRSKPADYWQKEMEIMGDQPVLTGEVHGTSTNPRDIFGYVDRHRDYRQHPSGTAGEMRDLLDYWHLARGFTDDPQLTPGFVACNPTERIFADSNTDTFQLMASHKVTARRLVAARARI